MSASWRYLRQIQVLGRSRQEALGAARVRASGQGITEVVEALYLAGAGVGTVLTTSEESAGAARALNPTVDVQVAGSAEASEDAETHAAGEALGDLLGGFEDETARAAAAGALRALRALR